MCLIDDIYSCNPLFIIGQWKGKINLKWLAMYVATCVTMIKIVIAWNTWILIINKTEVNDQSTE